MKDYSKMSDFEINKAIASSLGFKYIGRTWIDGADGIYHAVEKNDRRTDLPNYCNNPSDAWPIIIANKIMISPVMHMSDDNGEYLCNGEWEAGTLWSEDGAFYNSKYHCFSDENPLKAAMIVYLMMKDEEK